MGGNPQPHTHIHTRTPSGHTHTNTRSHPGARTRCSFSRRKSEAFPSHMVPKIAIMLTNAAIAPLGMVWISTTEPRILSERWVFDGDSASRKTRAGAVRSAAASDDAPV